MGILDRLPQDILEKAFRGDLVWQEEGDEGVGVLVERIKGEKGKVLNEMKRLEPGS